MPRSVEQSELWLEAVITRTTLGFRPAAHPCAQPPPPPKHHTRWTRSRSVSRHPVRASQADRESATCFPQSGNETRSARSAGWSIELTSTLPPAWSTSRFAGAVRSHLDLHHLAALRWRSLPFGGCAGKWQGVSSSAFVVSPFRQRKWLAQRVPSDKWGFCTQEHPEAYKFCALLLLFLFLFSSSALFHSTNHTTRHLLLQSLLDPLLHPLLQYSTNTSTISRLLPTTRVLCTQRHVPTLAKLSQQQSLAWVISSTFQSFLIFLPTFQIDC